MSLCLYPAIDVRGGRVVRLRQGDYQRETCYEFDPIHLARSYQEAGAQWLHLVDLDAARAGGYTLTPLLRALAATGLAVQTGGGVRGEADVETLLNAGAARVVVGSLAVREPKRVVGWIERYGAERITVALDMRRGASGWSLPVHGWTEGSGVHLEGLLEILLASPLTHVLCTDIERDGMLAGPNFELYRWLRERAPHWRLQASGGVRSAEDVAQLATLGVDGVVLGRALLEGRLEWAELSACFASTRGDAPDGSCARRAAC